MRNDIFFKMVQRIGPGRFSWSRRSNISVGLHGCRTVFVGSYLQENCMIDNLTELEICFSLCSVQFTKCGPSPQDHTPCENTNLTSAVFSHPTNTELTRQDQHPALSLSYIAIRKMELVRLPHITERDYSPVEPITVPSLKSSCNKEFNSPS